ncbi:MAG TPA: ABC transporter ATP-binding protein [Xanthobacteraceae bacterium]|nr:ABC transporter ATP-binding protein [Xanthobacteraceae bacterium]HQS49260.1 ABC transporter ATP-binding protein [Xanthobacteraceae bacterium]
MTFPALSRLAARPAPAAAHRTPVLEMAHVSASYGTRAVLHDASLAVSAGEITVLLGPNGAGKTTLIRAVCGRLRPDHGTVRVKGHAAHLSEARRRIGLVPQELALYPSLTVRENLDIFARLAGMPRAEIAGRVGAVMEAAGVAARANERIDRLSGGWKRRANIAAALVGEPALLVLDEPTVGVDRAALAGFADLLRALAAGGLAVLIVTHDLEQAAAVADRVAILVNGHVALEGPMHELVARRFGGARRVELRWSHPPDGDTRAHLVALALQSDPTGTTYTGGLAAGTGALADLLLTLEQRHVMPREVSVREPDLAALYADVLAEAAR